MSHSPAWNELKQQIIDKAVVHGKVILSSGREADYYVDLRRVTLDAVASPLVGQVMLETTSDWDYQAVGGSDSRRGSRCHRDDARSGAMGEPLMRSLSARPRKRMVCSAASKDRMLPAAVFSRWRTPPQQAVRCSPRSMHSSKPARASLALQ